MIRGELLSFILDCFNKNLSTKCSFYFVAGTNKHTYEWEPDDYNIDY